MTTTNDVTGTARQQGAAVASTAKDQAGAVAGTAKQATAEVAGTAKEQASQVASETVHQVKQLADQTRQQASEQLDTQATKLAGTFRSLADELGEMAHNSESDGLAKKVVGDAASRARTVADQLEERGPQGLLEDLRSFARRRPGAFILASAVTGLVAGRLAKGAASSGSDGPSSGRATTRSTTGPSTTSLRGPAVTRAPQPPAYPVGTSAGVHPPEPAAGLTPLAPLPVVSDAELRGQDVAATRPAGDPTRRGTL